MMREVSTHTDPQAMIEAYNRHMPGLENFDRYVSLSRRDLERPWYRVTRDTSWAEPINPWTQRDRLPLLRGGLLGEIVYANEARILTDFPLAPDDPATPNIGGFRTLIAVPHFDSGEALNWVIHLRRAADFDPEEVPGLVWESSLFGRMTYNLVLAGKLREANAAMDEELASVARVQRALLPESLPRVGRLRLAGHSEPARRAGGDYYSARVTPDGRVALLVADVSGHTAQATVLMGMVHTLAHLGQSPQDPAGVLAFINQGLCESGPRDLARFATAFAATVDAGSGAVVYASAGHPPPRLVRVDGHLRPLDGVAALPLGIDRASRFEVGEATLAPGESLVCFTDGVTDAPGPGGERFGAARLDAILRGYAARSEPQIIVNGVREAVRDFGAGAPIDDDCTLLVASMLA